MWWLAVVLGLVGCGAEEEEEVSGPVRSVDVVEAVADAVPTETLAQPEVTLASLDVKLAVVGAPDQAPSGLALSFARPIIEADKLEAELLITPSVDGSWRWVSPEFMEFTPDQNGGFVPGTTYTAKLSALNFDGEELGDLSGIEEVSFTPPEFAFQHIQVTNTSYSSMIAVATFTGAVTSNPMEGVKAWVDGRQSASSGDFRVTAGRSGLNRIVYRLNRRRIRDAKKVSIEIPSYTGINGARSEGGTYDLVGGDTESPMTIKRISRTEGDTSQVVSVICHDSAVEFERYFYESGFSSYISTRCLLDAEAARDYIEVYPEVDYTISAGRGGFQLVGDFDRGPLFVRFKKGAPTVDGGILKQTAEQVLYLPGLQPKVEFAHSGRYLPKSSWRGMAVRHRNVDEVGIQVRRVSRGNLLYWMSGPDERANHRTSDLVGDTRFAVRGDEDVLQTTFIDLQDVVPASELGVYEITVLGGVAVKKETHRNDDTGMSEDEQVTSYQVGWSSRAVSRILLTDINLVVKSDAVPPKAKWAPRHRVWALDMATNAALPGVEIEVLKASGKVMSRCVTGKDGGCSVEVALGDLDPAGPMAITASKGSDFTYLKLNQLRLDHSDDAVHGEAYLSDKPYRASVYLDRGVYRPGDAAHISAILRQPGLKAPSAEMPVILKLKDPRNKLVRKLNLTTNGSGMVSYDHQFGDFAPTGSYSVTLEVAEREIGSKTFSVEEFVPERMKVTAKGAADHYGLQDKAAVRIEAKYLFGGSAAGSPVEMTCKLDPWEFKPKKNANLHYGVQVLGYEKSPNPMNLGAVQGEIGEDGTVTLSCPTAERAGAFRGGAKITADVAVFEGGSGRTTRSTTRISVHPDTFYIGLDSGVKKVKAKDALPVTGKVVDWNGEPSTDVDEVEIELFRLVSEWGWNWDAERREERYTRFLRPVSEGKRMVKVSKGSFSTQLTAQQDGEAFIIRASAGEVVQTDLRLPGHGRRYWWQPNETRVDQTPRPLKPTSMEIQVPESVEVGNNNEVIFHAPYQGRLLVAAETHELLTSEWLEVTEPGPVKWNFAVNGVVPNVYVSGLLVKDPHLDSAEAYLPDRAYGVQSVRVNPSAQMIDVKLDVPKEVTSNGTLTVNLDLGPTKGATTVTVAAVDEGILSLTQFKSPDPMKELFPRRRLGVGTEETIGWSIAVPAAGNSRSTGGDGEGPGGRVQAIKPVALWSGIVEVPESGKVAIKLDVPQYQGALRVMAVAADPNRIGTADSQVLVRDPLVLQTTLPRFLMAGDSIEVPVFVTNLSGKEREIAVEMSVETMKAAGVGSDMKLPSPVEMIGARTTSFRLADGANKTVVFRAKAKARTGAATFQVKASSDGLLSTEKLDVPFQAHGPRTRVVKTLAVGQGTTDLTGQLEGWVPTTEKSSVWVTSNPYGQALGHLEHVIRYPHGCIEQTTSSTRPLLYVSNLLPAVLPEAAGKENVDKMVMHGINRVLSMQTASGGFAYWPGSTHPNAWGTAYATHMLLDAKEQQYEVPESALKDALDFLESEVVTGKLKHYRSSEAYGHYVLARGGRGQKGRILAELSSRSAMLQGELEEQDFLLKAALYLAGDRRFEAELRNPKTVPLQYVRSNSWSYYSELRKRGMQLSVVQDLFKPTVGGDAESLARQVYDGLMSKSSSRYYTTQEIVWGVTGLGKRVKSTAAGIKPKLQLNGKEIARDPGTAGDPTWSVIRASEYSSVAVQLDQKPQGDLFAIVTSEGIRQDAVYEEGSSGLDVSRVYMDAEGDELDVSQLGLGEVVYTVITVANRSNERVQNIALVDRFPAGWEIENPRLGRGGLADFIDRDALWEADYLSLRDDRLEMFGALERGDERQVVYALRAVTAGQYTAPPVEAEAMYDPSIWARQLGQPVNVIGKWEDFFL
jgi:alpha-2-macroglobulin